MVHLDALFLECTHIARPTIRQLLPLELQLRVLNANPRQAHSVLDRLSSTLGEEGRQSSGVRQRNLRVVLVPGRVAAMRRRHRGVFAKKISL